MGGVRQGACALSGRIPLPLARSVGAEAAMDSLYRSWPARRSNSSAQRAAARMALSSSWPAPAGAGATSNPCRAGSPVLLLIEARGWRSVRISSGNANEDSAGLPPPVACGFFQQPHASRAGRRVLRGRAAHAPDLAAAVRRAVAVCRAGAGTCRVSRQPDRPIGCRAGFVETPGLSATRVAATVLLTGRMASPHRR